MNKWPHQVPTLTQETIFWAIDDEVWQSFRKQLKGLTTKTKLIKLNEYLVGAPLNKVDRRRVQVANYINALKRGGQLSPNLEVVR